MLDGFKAIVPTGLRFTVNNTFAQGDWVAVEAQGNAVTADGTKYQNNYAFLFRLENGKIKQINEYFCNVHADEVLWPVIARSSLNTETA